MTVFYIHELAKTGFADVCRRKKLLSLNGLSRARVMMSMLRLSLCALSVLFGWVVLRANPVPLNSANPVIDRVEQHYNRAKTLTVSFAEQYSVQGHRRPSESGTLTIRKQGKMRWDYAQPAGKVFVSDGKMVYLYTPTENKVEEIPLRDTEDMRAPLAFLLGHLDLKKEFVHFIVQDEHGQTWLRADARGAKAPYETIEMLVSPDGGIDRLNVRNRDQSSLSFELSHEQLNPVVSEAFFAFKIPPGAEVVHSVEYAGGDR